MTFMEVVRETMDEGMHLEWARLNKITWPKTPIEQMVDDATGRTESIFWKYCAFVYAYVWEPLTERGTR